MTGSVAGSVVQLKTGVASAHVDSFAARGLPPAELQPAFLFERPELAYPERLNCVTAFVDRHVAEGRGSAPPFLPPTAPTGPMRTSRRKSTASPMC